MESSQTVDSVESFLSLKNPTETQYNSVPEKDKLSAFRNYLKVCNNVNHYIANLFFHIQFK